MVSSINMNSKRALEKIQDHFHNAQDERSPDRYQSVPVFNQDLGRFPPVWKVKDDSGRSEGLETTVFRVMSGLICVLLRVQFCNFVRFEYY